MRVGRAISMALHAAGYRMVINYNSSAAEAEALVRDIVEAGGAAIAVSADVSRHDDVARLLDTARDEYGRLDLVVNNAAIFEQRSFLEIDDELWRRTLAVNLDGPFHVAQGAARMMLQGDGGRIINICGTAGVSPLGNYTAYCVAKAGLDTLTRCMAQALAPRIQVNGVAPGTVLFPEETSAADRRAVADQIPAGGIGTPADIAAAVCFLADAPDYITGTIVTVDGGASLGSA